MKTKFILGLVIAFLSSAASADAMRDLLIRAIDLNSIEGVLTDATGKLWQQQTGSPDPVNVRITVLSRFKQEGCARLQVQMWQSNIPTTDGKKIKGSLPFQMNLCRDGSPPIEGIDRAALQKQIQDQQSRVKSQ